MRRNPRVRVIVARPEDAAAVDEIDKEIAEIVGVVVVSNAKLAELRKKRQAAIDHATRRAL